ncbi:hypothetical protein [Ferrimonas senticii]|uniref:hypothetical protein n=1 Tax=Ferrimonas senticii TaxID=394566 RepID=UPI000410540F|nr:hypothetical protein [Ferrimonas senticii]
MTTANRSRLLYLCLLFIVYATSLWLMPDSLNHSEAQRQFALASALMFLVLPLMNWWLLIRTGINKAWRLLLVFGLSSTLARFTFPAELQHYFEFIMWLRFPIIAIVVLFELALVGSVLQSLWQCRKQTGDPRVSAAINNRSEADEKRRTLKMISIAELTAWLHLLPWLRRTQATAITNLNTLMAHRVHLLAILTLLLLASSGSYVLLLPVHSWLAVGVSGIIAYGLIHLLANHFIARDHSVYLNQQELVLNVGLWGMMVVNINDIAQIELGDDDVTTDASQLTLGRANQQPILRLTLAKPQHYYSAGGIHCDTYEQLQLHLDNPEVLLEAINAKQTSPLAIAS